MCVWCCMTGTLLSSSQVHYANNFTAGSAGYYMYTIAAGRLVSLLICRWVWKALTPSLYHCYLP